ncbi:MAG: hypothetical protein PT977_04850 [Acidobacteriota bacterium]|nr:hypothetical protein [Acidobacteriota bacterium]
MDPVSAARALLPAWLPFVSLLAFPFGFAAGWLARKRTRLAAVMVSSVVGALMAHLGGPASILGPAVAGFLGGSAVLAGYAVGRRRTPAPPAGGIARRAALVLAWVLVFLAAEAGRVRVLPPLSLRSPMAAVVLTGGEAWTLANLARACDAGRRPEAVAFYRAAFALDGRPEHLAIATFVESHAGRCSEAKALADEAARAVARVPVRPGSWEANLVTRARTVADHCGGGIPETPEED